MHVPRISQRNDPLLDQIPQILDRRTRTTGTTTTSARTDHTAASANRREEQARGSSADSSSCRRRGGRICVQALGVPFARGGRRSSHCRHRRAICDRA